MSDALAIYETANLRLELAAIERELRSLPRYGRSQSVHHTHHAEAARLMNREAAIRYQLAELEPA